jgi:hypothetical protein
VNELQKLYTKGPKNYKVGANFDPFDRGIKKVSGWREEKLALW